MYYGFMFTSSKTILSLSAVALLVASNQIPMFAGAPFACPTGLGEDDSIVIGSSCYAQFSTSTKTWSEAKAACAGLGGTLAIIRGASENTAVHSIIGATEPWIGAADDNALISGSSEGEFFWIGDNANFWTGGQGGSAVGSTYNNWNGGEPNDAGGGEDCVQMYASGVWNDYDCSDSKAYVCQVVATRSTSSSSSVGNGGGVRPHTLQKLIDESLQRKSGKMSNHPAASQQSSVATTPNNRVCTRILKQYGANPKALEKVNARLRKTQGFTCQK